MKTWIFAQPEATGSNGWVGKAIVAGLDITSVDRAPAFYEEDAKLIASAPALHAENEQLKLQNGEWKLLAGSLLQRVHDLGLHQKSIQFCEEPTCKAAYSRLAENRKCGHRGPAELLCEREEGHDGDHMGDCAKAYPSQKQKCGADKHDWQAIPQTPEGLDAKCRNCGDLKET